MRSRFQRQKRKKLHVSLNALICIVLVLIFVVAGNIIWGDSNEASTNNQQNQTRSESEQSNQQNNDTTIRKDKETDLKKQDIKLRENKKTKEQQEAKRIQKDSEEAKKEQKAQKDREEQKAKDARKEREQQRPQDEKRVTGSGASKPIGTSQTGPHTSSYVKGSVDWNEKVKAIQMATGLGDNMNIWRIENGGGPQKSVGKVSPDGEDSWMYVVNLEWVDQKGWKITSVSKQNR